MLAPRSQTPQQTGAPRRVALLDGARFLAALAVVVFHFVGRPSPAWQGSPAEVFPVVQPVAAYGALGVYLFFMISGFVVLMSAMGRDTGVFIAARIARLFPAYWFAVLATALLLIGAHRFLGEGDWSRIGVPGVIANLTMMQPVLGFPHVEGVYWTLWVELKFYLLIAVLLMVGLTRGRLIAFAIVWPIAGALARATDQRLLVELLFPDAAPYFVIGMMVFLIHREGARIETVLVGVLNVALAMALAPRVVDFYVGAAQTTLSVTFVALSVPVLALLLLAMTTGRLGRVEWRWLTVAGALTYPLYLLHEMFGWYIIRTLTPAVPAGGAVIVATLSMCVVAWAVHRWVERPLAPVVRSLVVKAWIGATRSFRDAVRPGAPGEALAHERQRV